jgi:uncharacterized membrane protein
LIGFLHPELLLLALPLGALLWHFRAEHPFTTALRALGGLALVAALAGPYLKTRAVGRDVVIVVDRSRSMPAGSDEAALELIGLAEGAAGAEDRVHVVAFGARAHIERAGGSGARLESFQRDVDVDGSDLAGALDAALELVGAGRGSLLVVSDGESQGRDPLEVARRAANRGVRIDARELARPSVSDVSVERIALPGEIAAGEPFQFDVWVRSDRKVERELVLARDGLVLARGKRVIEPGLQRFTFRDIVGAGGVAQYDVTLVAPGDPGAATDSSSVDRVPENDRARDALLVSGPRAVLVINEDGREDTLSATLRAASLDVHVSAPEGAPLDPVSLSRYRAVILENVAASRLGRAALSSLAGYVEEHGGGLLMTGGKAAFGAGGYHKSPLDEVFPVSTELRQEHRKLSIALAITMDRSGSMAAPVAGGGTKMDLANAGAAAAIELLTPNDSLAVIAVDSAPHVIQGLTDVTDPGSLIAKVRTIQSMGGGIFTHTALLAAARELQKAVQLNRHVVLFADAADAEEHEGCFELIATLRKQNTTLSVIALGTESDSDASFLKECARRGEGGIYFSTDPQDLPRLFALDTLTMSRSTFVEEPTATKGLASLVGMGAFDASDFPGLAGYNLCYLRPGATAGAITLDEYAAPVLAFWQRGLGRSAALTAQVGGAHGGSLVAWPKFPEFAVTLARWLAGNEPPTDFFATTRREGREAVITVEVDPNAALAPDTSRLVARFASSDGERRTLALTRVDQFSFEARLPLDREGVLVGTVDLGDGRSLALAPQTLAYSPEFERGPDPARGGRVLRQITAATGGSLDPSAQELFRGARGARLWRIVTRELALVGLLLLLLEIAGRRLSLWGSVRVPRTVTGKFTALQARWAARAARRDSTRAATRPKVALPSAGASRDVGGGDRDDLAIGATQPTDAPAAVSKPADPNAPADLGSALERARRSSQRKLDR